MTLSPHQHRALSLLAEHGELTGRRIADELGMHEAQMLMGTLRDRGLVATTGRIGWGPGRLRYRLTERGQAVTR